VTFEEWVRPHLERAYRTAVLVVGDPEAARDAVQEALVRAHLARGRFREGAPLWPWLRRIVVREALRLRREGGPPAPDGWEEWATAPADLEPAARVEAWERQARVWSALGRLDGRLRAAIVLHHLHGLPVRELGAVLGVPAGTAKWLLHEARLRLRAELADLAAVLPGSLRGVARAMAVSTETLESLVAVMSPYRAAGWLLPADVRPVRRLVLLWYWHLVAPATGEPENAFPRVPALAGIERRPEVFAEARRLWAESYNRNPPRTLSEAEALDRLFYDAMVGGHGVADPDGAVARRLGEEHRGFAGGVLPDVREACAALRGRATLALLSHPDMFELRSYADCGLLSTVDAVAPTSKDFGARTSHTAEEAAERYRELAEAFGVAPGRTTVVASAEWYAPYLTAIGMAGMHGVLLDRYGRARPRLEQVGWRGPVLADLRSLPSLIA
jgi:RNA polymerase sigma-70 factor (ECF subfamily)